MKAYILFSGSKGNCTYLTDGETSLLVDAGSCLKRIRESLADLGQTLDNINGIFITHEHTDHTKALYNIVKKHDVRVYASTETARGFCTPYRDRTIDDCRRLAGHVMTVRPEKTYEIGTISIKTFPTSHDTEGSLGFVFTSLVDGQSLGYATDTGVVTEGMYNAFCGIKNVVLEANHDLIMLRDGPYPEYLKERIRSEKGHLSNEQCASFVKVLVKNGAKSFVLAHLSEENNLPSVALSTVKEAVEGFDGITIKTASQYSITEVEIL